MHVKDEMIYLFLCLTILSLVGMLVGSWRIILYPYLLVVGLMVSFGLWKYIRGGGDAGRKRIIPFVVTIAYFVLFISFDLTTYYLSVGKDSYIVGLTPSMAIYMLAILPSGTLVCLLYALSFNNDLSIDETVKHYKVGG